MIEVRKSEDRGVDKLDWLDANYTFSFGPYKNPEEIGFSDLRLLNDDRVKGGGGFASHAHVDTEVFSYVLSGELTHKDSTGFSSVVSTGEVLTMSTGTGITHGEFNQSSSDGVHFLQAWMVPDRKGVTPRYGQKRFADAEKRGRLRCIIAPDERDGALLLYLNGCVYAGLIDGQERAEISLAPGRYGYVHVIRGDVGVNGTRLHGGDGARIRHVSTLVFSDGHDAEVLLFDLRPRELPEL